VIVYDYAGVFQGRHWNCGMIAVNDAPGSSCGSYFSLLVE